MSLQQLVDYYCFDEDDVGILSMIAREWSVLYVEVASYDTMSIRMLLYLEGTSGLNENHMFLVGRESVN